MSTRGAIAWVIAAAVLVCAYYFSGKMEVERRITAIEAKQFFEFDADAIRRIGITTREHELIEAERVGGGQWTMLAPYPHIAPNHALWEQLAASAPLLINERTIEESPEDLSLYGLDNPPLRLTLEAGGSVYQLSAGKLDPTQNNRYAQLGDGAVFLLPSRMAEAFHQPLDSLRDTRVFPDVAEGADRIQIQRFDAVSESGLEEAYVLDDQGEWKMIEPQEAVVFQNELLHLLNDLSFLQGANYVDDPESLSDFGLDDVWARIEVSNSETGMHRALLLGWLDDMADDGRMFAAIEGSPSVFTIDAAFIARLPDEPGDYREKRLFTGEASKLTSIRYQDRNHGFVLSNDEDAGWKLTEPPHDDTDNLLVSRFISILKQFSGTRFPNADETDFGEERIRYTFDYSDGTQADFAILGSVPDSDPIEFYARQDVGTVITVPMEAVHLFSPKPFTFRNRQIFNFDLQTWSRISMTLDGERRTLALDERQVSVAEPPNHGIASESELGFLLRTLPTLVALDVQTVELDDATMGFDEPTLVVEVDVPQTDGTVSTKRLEIGDLIAESSDRRFARVEGRSEVFHVQHGYIQDLRNGLKSIVPGR